MQTQDLLNRHKGESCLLLTCGPSLNQYPVDTLLEAAKDRVVVAVKQAYDKIPEVVDYHFWNCCNLPLPNNGIHYNYPLIGGPTVIASSNFGPPISG